MGSRRVGSVLFLCVALVTSYAVVCARARAQESERVPTGAAAVAGVPRLIRIRGVLRRTSQEQPSPTAAITFTLYKEQSGDAAVWMETQNVPVDASGHYSVLLGASSDEGLPLSVFSSGAARWLGVRMEGEAEQPRILLLSVAYALQAADSEMLGGLPASAFVRAGNQNSPTQTSPQMDGRIPVADAGSGPLLVPPPPACSAVTSDGTATANQITKFTAACNIENSALFEAGGNVGIGNTNPGATLDVSGTALIRGELTANGGLASAPTGTATTSQGYPSSPFDAEASVYSAALSKPATYIFRWAAEPVGNNTSNTGASMNLQYGVMGSIGETGLSIARNGVITFSPSQTFPGSSGTVTTVNTGTGLTGGPITTTGTISIPNGGVTNSLLANSSVTVQAGTGLSGGGAVALGGTITLTNSAPGLGGTVTSVGSGTGLTGGPITGSGSLSLDTSFTDGRDLQLSGGTLTGALKGSAATFTSGTFSALLSAAGALMPKTGTATATQGFVSNPFDFQASSFSSTTSAAVTQDFRWQAEPTGNNTANPSGSMNLLFGANGATPAETGLSIASNGLITFATGQTFPGGGGSGTVTSVGTGAGLTGGPITTSGTISIPSAGVTNAMLANNSINVVAGSGLSGGGSVALGGSVTLSNTASGGTVTSVNTGAGLTGGPITQTGTISIPSAGVTNAMLANNSINVVAGSGLSGGGSVALGGSVTLSNAASGGTVTSVNTGAGLTGGPITQTGTISIPSAGVANSMLANSSIKVVAGTGLSGGGTVALGGTVTLNNTASGGTVTTVNTGAGLTGGPITTSGTVSIPSAGVTNAMLANSSINVVAGSGLSGGGAVALGGSVTLSSNSSGGTVTTVNTGAGLTGGPITQTGTISIPSAGVTNAMLANSGINVVAGSGLSGGGAVALGGTVTLASNASGTANGIAYFSGANTVTSTGSPTNGQLLVGSSGKVPVLAKLTAGQNITITNGPGSITIAAAGGGGSPTMPFFATGGQRTGGYQAPVQNFTKLWGFLLPYAVTTSQVTYDVYTADKTSNTYDLGIYDASGNLVVNIGPTAGSTFAPAKGFLSRSWTQGSTTIAPGKYYLAMTTNCSSACFNIASSAAFVSFAVNISAGKTTGGALPSSITPPADTWGGGLQPTVVIQ